MLIDHKGVEINLIRIDHDKIEEMPDLVAKEKSLSIFVNGKKLVHLQCSPGKFRYLGIGFLYTTGIIKKKEDILSIGIGLRSIKINLKNFQLPDFEMIQFNASDGRKDKIPKKYKSTLSANTDTMSRINPNTIFSLISKMEDKSSFFKRSGGVHSCGLASFDGSILLFCEDISRYNTIDRIFGEAFLRDIRLEDKILLTSCRITSGIMKKITVGNVPIVISRSALTDSAIYLAHQKGVTLVGFARGKRMNIYTHFERIIN